MYWQSGCWLSMLNCSVTMTKTLLSIMWNWRYLQIFYIACQEFSLSQQQTLFVSYFNTNLHINYMLQVASGIDTIQSCQKSGSSPAIGTLALHL